ncbi:methylaspartate ammonia-lyase [bacterium]|nr:methylaspartate ammonia-lyase [bacterium]
MRIADVVFSKGNTGFFFDDQRAIKSGLGHDGFVYVGEAVTPGFTQVRQAGESVSVMLVLEDGQIAVGDCAAVQYSGAGGRDPLFLADTYIPFLRQHIAPMLIGRELGTFREMAREFDALEFEGHRLHTAVRYGLSQALLEAVAKAHHCLMAEVIAAEYGLPLIAEPVPIFAQSGDDRYTNVDKMILKGADVLPHALINAIEGKLGRHGEDLQAYVSWLSERIRTLRPVEAYNPCLHIDCYGTIALIFDNDPREMAAYLATLEKAAKPFQLYIEGPMDMGERQAQIDALAALRAELERQQVGVRIVADEWCNTYEDVVAFTDAKCCHMVQIKTPDLGSLHNTAEAVLYCKKHGMEAYQGGTCNETDISARACVHVALGVRSERLLAKPGMGFDEGYMVVRNEMNRTIAMLQHKKG